MEGATVTMKTRLTGTPISEICIIELLNRAIKDFVPTGKPLAHPLVALITSWESAANELLQLLSRFYVSEDCNVFQINSK